MVTSQNLFVTKIIYHVAVSENDDKVTLLFTIDMHL